MIDRKSSINPISSNNTKNTHLVPQSSYKHQKQRSTLNPNENYYSQNPNERQDYNQKKKNKKQRNQIFIQKKQNVPIEKISSYRNSLQQSLLNKLKKLGYVSGVSSKPLSPNNKQYQINLKNKQEGIRHKRNFSSGEEPLGYRKENFLPIKEKENTNGFHKGLFSYKYVIGKGGFGKVWKVQLKRNGKIYALKEMSKALILAKKSVPSVMNEKKLLATLKNDFIVNMVQSFQDRETLYLVMDYLPGGDLRYHIAKSKRFLQQQAKFIISCIILGLQYIHTKNIIHRDIKPQNLVLDEKGYVRITDLGVARNFRMNNSSDTSGTPGYMAPEVLCRQNHAYSVDHFAVGIIAYELMLRRRPYFGRNRKQIRDQVLARQVQIKKHQIPDDWSLQSADFINRLIQRKPTNRLGFNSSEEIRNHPWLRQYPFDKLVKKQFRSPLLQKIEIGWNEQNHKISSQNTQTKQLIMQNQIMLRNDEVQQLFHGYESSQK